MQDEGGKAADGSDSRDAPELGARPGLPVSPDEAARRDLVRWCDEQRLPAPPPASGKVLLRR